MIQVLFIMRITTRTAEVVPWNVYASIGFSVISLFHRVLARYLTACTEANGGTAVTKSKLTPSG